VRRIATATDSGDKYGLRVRGPNGFHCRITGAPTRLTRARGTLHPRLHLRLRNDCRAPDAVRPDPAGTPARRGSNIRGIGGSALISRPRKCSVSPPVRVKLRQAAFNNDIFANPAPTKRG